MQVDIVYTDDEDKEHVVESKDFPNAKDEWDPTIETWTYNKLLEYDNKYDFNNWENCKYFFEFKYTNKGKVIEYSPMLEEFMGL